MVRVEQIDYSVFNQGMAGLIQKCKIDSRLVVEKETGELIKTLVRISPPKSPEITKARIESQVKLKFDVMAEKIDREDKWQLSKKYGGTIWYGVTSTGLFGMTKVADKRRASADELRDIFLRTKFRKGRAYQTYSFIGRDTDQKIFLRQRTLTSKAGRNRLIRRFQKNVGRLKAGWLVASAAGRIRFSTNYAVPQWVSRHVPGGRGRFENGLDETGNPHFLIANFAKGITGRAAAFLGQRAINIRGKAMLQNARMFLSGKKNLGDYARFSGTTP